MTGMILRGGAFTGSGSKPFVLDPILSDGSLFLIDVKNWDAGVPSNGARLPNIARIQAGLLGIDDSAATFAQVGDLVSGGYGAIERTAKQGLHVMVRQSADVPANNGFNINLPPGIVSYMLGNDDHEFYFSQWRKLTRVAKTTSPGGAKTFAAMMNASSTANAFFLMSHSSTQEVPNSANLTGKRVSGAGQNVLGNTIHNLAGPPTGVNDGTYMAAAQFGAVAPQNTYSVIVAALPSWVFYRCYLEDLTVSGRTYAEVDALDYALWQSAFAPGGRFDGDTHSNPATVAP